MIYATFIVKIINVCPMFCIQMDTKRGSTLYLSGDKYIYHRIDIKHIYI